MWQLYSLTLRFTGRLCGSVPQSGELIRAWLESRMPDKKPEDAESIDDLEADVAATIAAAEEAEKRVTLGFQRDERGLFVRSDTLKAHLKDCSNQIRELESIRALKVTALRSKVANKVYVEPPRIYLLRDGKHITAEDGAFDRAVHAMGPRGQIDALKRISYVEQPTLSFTLRVLDDGVITEKILRTVLDYGGVHGYGGERGMDEGKYTYELSAQS